MSSGESDKRRWWYYPAVLGGGAALWALVTSLEEVFGWDERWQSKMAAAAICFGGALVAYVVVRLWRALRGRSSDDDARPTSPTV